MVIKLKLHLPKLNKSFFHIVHYKIQLYLYTFLPFLNFGLFLIIILLDLIFDLVILKYQEIQDMKLKIVLK